jgi:CRISPR/Cas system-associated exonuclease Cas4 (RecB family)
MTLSGPFAHFDGERRLIDASQDSTVRPGSLPPLFQFSQNSLQDYADCKRRFQLRFVEGQHWPAARSEPIEEHEQFVNHGVDFHLLAQRHLLGIPVEELAPVENPLAEWWDAYLHYPPPDLPTALRLPEVQLSVPLSGYRLMAKFDLLAIDPGQRAVIVDWKTSRKRTPHDQVLARLQTHVYPYVLVEAGTHLFGGPIDPERVSLIYWFATAPTDPEIIPYSAARHVENRAYLEGLIEEILSTDDEIWPLVEDDFVCRFCEYRSLCDRGVQAGSLDEIDAAEEESDWDFEWDDVEEIAF